ncbi:MAG TPA: FeoA family protein [Chitinophagales bacterium]|nr:ferrous iron transport protein A [Chitinophagales bacterium]MBP6154443.1 ferrous iron transport protein A [Chitinophagales bacterium]HQV77658.1 FeoA family protein [Chitinophagales bacterium]HQW78131.1 FeoA family protein [Chitinophagales bacterium]HRB66974.1 FeoA family protein [Chitinophagales bacterium]
MNITRNITVLRIGEQAQIVDFANNLVARKLMAMGLLPGSSITLVRSAPFGGAFYIKSEHHYIALRKEEAKQVLISND